MDWMCPSPQIRRLKSYPRVLVLGGGAFGRCWGHEGGALTLGINALIKELPERSLLFPRCENSGEVSSLQQEEGPHQNPTRLAPYFQASSIQNCDK